VAFDTRLLSLMDPVLPDAFGYVIIDNEGKVLFHSDEVHHLGENLFQECDDDNEPALSSDRTRRQAAHQRALFRTGSTASSSRLWLPSLTGRWWCSETRSRCAALSRVTHLAHVSVLLYTPRSDGRLSRYFSSSTITTARKRGCGLSEKVELYVQLFYVMLVLSFVSLILTLFLHGSSLVLGQCEFGVVQWRRVFCHPAIRALAAREGQKACRCGCA
jgi:hypothetical protein